MQNTLSCVIKKLDKSAENITLENGGHSGGS